jgi:hypothetical protein
MTEELSSEEIDNLLDGVTRLEVCEIPNSNGEIGFSVDEDGDLVLAATCAAIVAERNALRDALDGAEARVVELEVIKTNLNAVNDKYLKTANDQFHRAEAAEAKLARGVRIKPLVWSDVYVNFGGEVWDAIAAGVVYRIIQKADDVYWLTDPNCEVTTTTLEAAKAAAQADYEARILDTIDAVPVAQIEAETIERCAQARSEAIAEFCKTANIKGSLQAQYLPKDVKDFRLQSAVNALEAERRALKGANHD